MFCTSMADQIQNAEGFLVPGVEVPRPGVFHAWMWEWYRYGLAKCVGELTNILLTMPQNVAHKEKGERG